MATEAPPPAASKNARRLPLLDGFDVLMLVGIPVGAQVYQETPLIRRPEAGRQR